MSPNSYFNGPFKHLLYKSFERFGGRCGLVVFSWAEQLGSPRFKSKRWLQIFQQNEFFREISFQIFRILQTLKWIFDVFRSGHIYSSLSACMVYPYYIRWGSVCNRGTRKLNMYVCVCALLIFIIKPLL